MYTNKYSTIVAMCMVMHDIFTEAKGSRDVKLNVAEHEYQNTITLDNEICDQSIAAATSPCKVRG